MEFLISANIHLLGQAKRLLQVIADQDYADPVGDLFDATMGQHLRHCLDHYASFLSGVPGEEVNYDHRDRSPQLECSTECALAEVERLEKGLHTHGEADLQARVSVKMDCGGEGGDWHHSTLGRELQFLVSHTVHHFAMINGMCRQRGLSMEDGFGIAPSTLRHREMAKAE